MICDTCANYSYDEEYEYYVCEVDLDEDEMQRFLTGTPKTRKKGPGQSVSPFQPTLNDLHLCIVHIIVFA